MRKTFKSIQSKIIYTIMLLIFSVSVFAQGGGTHDSSEISPGSFGGGISDIFTFPGRISVGRDLYSNYRLQALSSTSSAAIYAEGVYGGRGEIGRGRIGGAFLGTASGSTGPAVYARNNNNWGVGLYSTTEKQGSFGLWAIVGSSSTMPESITGVRVDHWGDDGWGMVSRAYGANSYGIWAYADPAANSYAIGTLGDVYVDGDIDTTGSLCVGCDAPAVPLDVQELGLPSGSTLVRFYSVDGQCNGRPTTTGMDWVCSSDENLKENITDASSVIDDLNKFRIREFTVKSSGQRETGVIAQEVQEIFPNMVTVSDDGYLLVGSINQWKLVKAIQEQQDKIENLKTELSSLKSLVCLDHPNAEVCN